MMDSTFDGVEEMASEAVVGGTGDMSRVMSSCWQSFYRYRNLCPGSKEAFRFAGINRSETCMSQ